MLSAPRFIYRSKAYFSVVMLSTAFFWGIGGYMSFQPDWADYYMLPMLLGLMMPAVSAVVFIRCRGEAGMWQDFVLRTVSLVPESLSALCC